MPKETVSFEDVEALHETELALLVRIEGEKLWIPHTHVDDDSEVFETGGEGTLVITEWIAKQKGLV